MVKNFAPNFFDSELNLLESFMKNESNELILLKKESNSIFDIFCPHFRICIDSPLTKLQIAIIQEQIKLLI